LLGKREDHTGRQSGIPIKKAELKFEQNEPNLPRKVKAIE
jgi:hypothetical protein